VDARFGWEHRDGAAFDLHLSVSSGI
jgi:hypothetical protein